jgi:hypothetical protein
LDAYWLGVWRHALKVMKEQGSWAWELRPLLDEYVFALVEAQVFRGRGEDSKWDRATRRAGVLADQLALTPRGRKAAGIGEPDSDEDRSDEGGLSALG